MKHWITFSLLVFGFYSQAQGPTPEQIQQVEEAKKMVKAMKGKKFPDFEMTTMEGKTYSSQDLLGKTVLFNFWFVGCRPCIEELPEINSIAKEYSEDDIVFIAPTFDKIERVEPFLNRFPFEYEVVVDVKDFIVGNNIREFPTHFVIDREGYIEKVIIGYSEMTDGMLRRAINKSLK